MRVAFCLWCVASIAVACRSSPDLPDAAPPAVRPAAPAYATSYDEHELKQRYEAFAASVGAERLVDDYRRCAEDLRSNDPLRQQAALAVLAAIADPYVIPWCVEFLEHPDRSVQTCAGIALSKAVEQAAFKRRDPSRPEVVALLPLRPGDVDLTPIAWIVLRMLRNESSCLPGYACSMARYLELREFHGELLAVLRSPQPAYSGSALEALDALDLYVPDAQRARIALEWEGYFAMMRPIHAMPVDGL